MLRATFGAWCQASTFFIASPSDSPTSRTPGLHKACSQVPLQ
jgi:hypothetical protein